jgi:hypothetical protein
LRSPARTVTITLHEETCGQHSNIKSSKVAMYPDPTGLLMFMFIPIPLRNPYHIHHSRQRHRQSPILQLVIFIWAARPIDVRLPTLNIVPIERT